MTGTAGAAMMSSGTCRCEVRSPTVRNQTLDAEPFLVVGLIAGIRKVLIVTAEAGKSFRWKVEGIELVILAGLILVLATAT
ncbi:phosphate-starvation-inducible PsiE family protein [Streptomyces sp. NPDC058466]|uniref:phosphate-starvation-inducible PsiE family protein n=1 Tax=Streptomyces sp. NPDC058466 TaxID=3346512 RepID=UPI00364C7B49